MSLTVRWIIYQRRYTFNLDFKISILLWEQNRCYGRNVEIIYRALTDISERSSVLYLGMTKEI